MKTLTIVEDLDVLKEIRFRLPSRTVASMMNQILLERSKEAFHRGVVVDIARTAHAGQRFMGGQKMLVASAGILAAAVGMVKQTGQRLAVRNGHFEGLGGQGVRQERFHGPANYQPRIQVQNGRQIQPTFSSIDVSDISYPFLVWSTGRKGLGQMVLGHWPIVP